MEGLAAAHGGRVLKAGWLAFGSLLCAAPLFAQGSDPLAALPPGILTPVAKAELYTAKGSPQVDLAALQALIAQAPELPQANQLGLMAIKRGATTPPLVVPEQATVNLGSAPVRYKARPVQ